MPETLNQLPVTFNREIFLRVYSRRDTDNFNRDALKTSRNVLKTFRDALKTFRDAGSYMRVQYDARSLCQFASLLRGNHHKVPVSRNTKTKKYKDKEIQRQRNTKT